MKRVLPQAQISQMPFQKKKYGQPLVKRNNVRVNQEALNAQDVIVIQDLTDTMPSKDSMEQTKTYADVVKTGSASSETVEVEPHLKHQTQTEKMEKSPILHTKEQTQFEILKNVARVPAISGMMSDTRPVGIWGPEQYSEIVKPREEWEGSNRILIRGYVTLPPIIKNVGPTKELLLGRFLIRTFNTILLFEKGEQISKDVQSATISVVGFDRIAEGIQMLQQDDFVEVYGFLTTRAYEKVVKKDHPQQVLKLYDHSITCRNLTKFVEPNANGEQFTITQ